MSRFSTAHRFKYHTHSKSLIDTVSSTDPRRPIVRWVGAYSHGRKSIACANLVYRHSLRSVTALLLPISL